MLATNLDFQQLLALLAISFRHKGRPWRVCGYLQCGWSGDAGERENSGGLLQASESLVEANRQVAENALALRTHFPTHTLYTCSGSAVQELCFEIYNGKARRSTECTERSSIWNSVRIQSEF